VNYEEIKELSKELGRPAATLIALAKDNDPFFIMPGREADAKWAADVWRRFEIQIGYHKRRIHYRLVSQAAPIIMPNGEPYENTLDCWKTLSLGLRDAVTLGLLPPNAFTDNRNPDPILHQTESEEAFTWIKNSALDCTDIQIPDLPALTLERPMVPQPYQVEFWCEKSTMNDVLVPLAEEYHLNVPTAVGEFSATQCTEFVDRAEKHGRSVRILYISDFDPAGQDMPVSVARKIESELDRRGCDLDIQVRPIVLTHDQCTEYRLPRTPIKEKEKRGPKFQERFGEGATELDALEALHPGLLRRILVAEIERYWNTDHDDAVADTCREIEDQLDEITKDVVELHQPEIDALTAEFQEIRRSYRAWLDLARPLYQRITDTLKQSQPDIDGVDCAPDFNADEDTDPLFDSSRDYVEQIDRYKRHQDKPTARRRVMLQLTCVVCGTDFESERANAVLCSSSCRLKHGAARMQRSRATQADGQPDPVAA
jgi:hypothetical protein